MGGRRGLACRGELRGGGGVKGVGWMEEACGGRLGEVRGKLEWRQRRKGKA